MQNTKVLQGIHKTNPLFHEDVTVQSCQIPLLMQETIEDKLRSPMDNWDGQNPGTADLRPYKT